MTNAGFRERVLDADSIDVRPWNTDGIASAATSATARRLEHACHAGLHHVARIGKHRRSETRKSPKFRHFTARSSSGKGLDLSTRTFLCLS